MFLQGGPEKFPTARVFPIPRFLLKGSLVDPRMRASYEHIPIVRVPRAGGGLGYPHPPFFNILLKVDSVLRIRPILIGIGAQVLLDIGPGKQMAIHRLKGQLAVHKEVRPGKVYFVADMPRGVVCF